METKFRKHRIVWGSLLIFFGLLSLVETYTDLTAWTWVVLLAAGGLGVFGVYLTERSDWGLLIPAYVLWAVAGMIALIEVNVLRDESIAIYVLSAVALPFLVVFLRKREWWALIPAYVLWAIAGMIALVESNLLRDELIATYILAAIALPFLVVFLRTREWWALIPAYVLLAIGGMVGLIGARVLRDLLIPAYIMFAIALPFLVVYVRNPREWWALIPGGILAVIGTAFLFAESTAQFVGPVVLIIVGAWILVRQFTGKGPTGKGDDQAPAE